VGNMEVEDPLWCSRWEAAIRLRGDFLICEVNWALCRNKIIGMRRDGRSQLKGGNGASYEDLG